MEIKDNFNIFNLFLNKKVKIFVDQEVFQIKLPTIREFTQMDKINAIYHIWTLPEEKMQTIIPVPCKDSFDLVNNILFKFGIYKEYSSILDHFKEALEFFIPNIKIDYKNKKLIVDNITITSEI